MFVSFWRQLFRQSFIGSEKAQMCKNYKCQVIWRSWDVQRKRQLIWILSKCFCGYPFNLVHAARPKYIGKFGLQLILQLKKLIYFFLLSKNFCQYWRFFCHVLESFWKTGVFSSNRLLVLDFLTRGRVGGLSSFPNSFLWPVLFWPECGFDMFCSNYAYTHRHY